MFIVLIIPKRPLLNPAIMDTFHPTSNLPCLEKVMEKEVSLHLQRPLGQRESGFISIRIQIDYSNVMALTAFTNDIWWAQSDLDSTAIRVLHDCSTAFNILNYNILLIQLREPGSTVLQ